MDTGEVVDYILEESLDSVPDPVSSDARIRVQDTIAAISAGHVKAGTGDDIVTQYVIEKLPDGDATVLDGSGRTRDLAGASFANATAANALDIDEGRLVLTGHPAAIVVPPALAAAEITDASVREFLEAVIVGYEVGTRQSIAIREFTGLHTGTGSWGPVGAAAAIARLEGLDRRTLHHALSIAEYHAPRSPIMRNAVRPGMTKDGIGWGGFVGAVSVELAERGFTGSGTVFDEPDISDIPEFGSEYIIDDGYYKPYPACQWTIAGIDAAITLREEHGIDPGEIRAIRVETFEQAAALATRRPTNPDRAEYSYPYVLAAALVRGQFTPAELEDDALTDDRILDLADRVTLSVDESLDARYPGERLSRVEIDTTRGTYSSGVNHAPGGKERPLSESALREKIEGLLDSSAGRGTYDHVSEAIHSPDSLVRDLLAPWR